MTPGEPADIPPALPAATAVLLRDGPAGLETLMLRRGSAVAFGGMWVFPGGRVDPEDHSAGDPDDESPARRAAAREALEECGVAVAPASLVAFAHWTPPPVTPRRYATWFFLGRADSAAEVVVDGVEIREHAWLAPGEVLRRRDRGEVDLAPPTWVTLHDLASFAGVAAALDAAAQRRPVPRYQTRWAEVDGGAVALWEGDAGYQSGDPSVAGGRHRLWMLRGGWRFERA